MKILRMPNQLALKTTYMKPDVFTTILVRDLNKLKAELNAYFNESSIWQVLPGTTNSAGNLALHLVGNLNHYIGHVLGKSGYQRQRDKEFSLKDVPRKEIILAIDYTADLVKRVMDELSEADLEQPFPEKYGDEIVLTGYFLVHLCSHAAYHIGQVNYHRRLLHYIPA